MDSTYAFLLPDLRQRSGRATDCLVITDGSIIRDPARTYDGCSTTGSMGKWTFGALMTQMANQYLSHRNRSVLIS